MLLHGGGFEHYETGRVTHIVATHLPASKLLQLKAPASSSDRVILHVDMDCFFVAVAARGKPELHKVPVAVAHSGNAGSSEISSCNYLARAKGVGAGMFMQTAKELCPELIVLPYQFDAIERVSFQIYDIFFSHTPYVQAVSCDEAFLEFGRGMNGMEKANTIRKKIFEQTGCSASVGVSFNVLLAKLSSKKAKPDGIFQIADSSQAEEFMLQLKIRDLPGAGHMTGAKLEALGVEDVPRLVSITRGELVQSLGKASGEMLYNYARGIDLRPLSMESNMMRKSVSAVVNFGIRFEKWEDVTVFLMALGEELSHRLRNLKVRTKCLTLLIKKRAEGAPIEPSKFMGHGVCDNFSKSHFIAQPTDDEVVIGKACIELLRQFNFPSEELRGVGVQATKLISDAPGSNQRSGQLFKAWLNDSTQQSGNAASLNPQQEECEAKTEDEPHTDRNTNEFPATSFSQINMGVLEELPEQLQQEILASEIDRYAKKRRLTSTVCPIPRPRDPSVSGPDQAVKKSTPVVLPKIEDLFANLVESLEISEYPTKSTRAQSAAFDAIYSRILFEVENRALDQALRMLRFVRRKCSSAATPRELSALLKSGFNHVLNLVNQDIRRHFNGVLSLRLVAHYNISKWPDGTPIEYQVKVGDIFDYYTSSDGILQAPKWKSFLYAVEDYLENDPRLTYHPSRVRHFIEENGIDNLEKME
ncbi:DNA polymerase, Y-family, little finger domain [Phytophthora cactorum]|nr:DNA polymerase, Y-family, little finger domain [Phytophthora cactorum]